MTDIERLANLEKTFTELLDGVFGANMEALKPTVKELLALAFHEERITEPIGMCGLPCNGTCATCDLHAKLMTSHFADLVAKQKELNEIAPPVEIYETLCTTCGNICISYEMDCSVSWLCEKCYRTEKATEIDSVNTI